MKEENINDTEEMRRLFAVATEDMAPGIELIVIGDSTNGLGQVDPRNLLALLRNSSQVTEQGPASGPGWTGTAYRFTARLTTRGPLHITLSSTGTVDVDHQGRVRQLDATQTFG